VGVHFVRFLLDNSVLDKNLAVPAIFQQLEQAKRTIISALFEGISQRRISPAAALATFEAGSAIYEKMDMGF
jgi:hypothetical protein